MVDPFEEREKLITTVSSLFNVWVLDDINMEVEGKGVVQENISIYSTYIIYLSVYTVSCSITNIWPFTMLFLFCMNTLFSLFIFVTFITYVILLCIYNSIFTNKVFLELYAIDCTFYATTSSVYQITISFSKVKQKQFFSLLNM